MRKIFGSTDKGLVRVNNQDRFDFGILSDTTSFAIVCDGMGGENGGNIASDMAVEFAKQALERDFSSNMTELSIRALFSTIFSGANAKIHETSIKEPTLKGMGTTMILAIAKDEELYIGSVGDSRAYIANPEQEEQITKDHTVVQMMVDSGELTENDALTHPKRHYITRAVGVSDTVDMDFFVSPFPENTLALLCSDGLYGYLEKGTLYQLLTQCVTDQSADSLISLAKSGGGSDNITAVIMV